MSIEQHRTLQRYTLNGATMGTRFSAVICAAPGLDEASTLADLQNAVDEVNNQMSAWDPESDLMRLNRTPVGQWMPVPTQMARVLEAALAIQQLSDGAFDVSVGAAVNAWGFGARGETLELETIVALAAQEEQQTNEPAFELDLEQKQARRIKDRQLDLSGIAKGFGVDRLAETLEAQGLHNFLVSIDGELRCKGTREDGSPWRIAVEAPETGHRRAEELLEVQDIAVATSGDYRHQRQIGDMAISHTMDGRSHRPVNNDLNSVTVFSNSCMLADAWATALMVMGKSAALETANTLNLHTRLS